MKDIFMIIDTETTNSGFCIDFGAIVTDRKGNILESFGGVVKDKRFKINDLFVDKNATGGFWALSNLKYRINKYTSMLNTGERALISVNYINNWINRMLGKYPKMYLTAYNLPFDKRVMYTTGINFNGFKNEFCLYRAFKECITANSAELASYREFCIKNNYLGKRDIRTNADIATKYIMNDINNLDEPHTALEDARDYERLILKYVSNKRTKKQYMNFSNENNKLFKI